MNLQLTEPCPYAEIYLKGLQELPEWKLIVDFFGNILRLSCFSKLSVCMVLPFVVIMYVCKKKKKKTMYVYSRSNNVYHHPLCFSFEIILNMHNFHLDSPRLETW